MFRNAARGSCGPRFSRGLCALASLGGAFALAMSSAQAAPPLFTEDAETAARGELGVELWLEGMRSDGDHVGLGWAELAFGATEWLEIAAAVGVGIDDEGGATLPNPYAHLKFELYGGDGGTLSSLGVMALAVAPVGLGAARDDGTALGAIAPATFSFADDRVLTHLHAGVTAAVTGERTARPFWGVGVELDVPRAPIDWLGEVSAGDPFDPGGPRMGVQTGVMWEVIEGVAIDASLAAMAEDAVTSSIDEWIARLGVSWDVDLLSAPADREE